MQPFLYPPDALVTPIRETPVSTQGDPDEAGVIISLYQRDGVSTPLLLGSTSVPDICTELTITVTQSGTADTITIACGGRVTNIRMFQSVVAAEGDVVHLRGLRVTGP